MKLKGVVAFFVAFAVILLGNLVFAAETDGEEEYVYSDFSNATFEVLRDDSMLGSSYVKIDNIKIGSIKKYPYQDFCVYISNDINDAPDISRDDYLDQEVKGTFGVTREVDDNTFEIDSTFVSEQMAKNGDVYLWVIEEENLKNRKFVVEAKKLERVPTQGIGATMEMAFFEDRTAISIYTDTIEGMTVDYELGVIEDNSILKAYQKNRVDGLNKLLEYAKNSTPMYKSTISIDFHGGDTEPLPNNVKLEEDKFYYCYMKIGGEYYPVEDIGIYQAIVTDNGRYALVDENFAFEDSPSDNQNNTINNVNTNKVNNTTNTNRPTRLPSAGKNMIIIMAVIALVSFGGFTLHKYNKYKGIK